MPLKEKNPVLLFTSLPKRSDLNAVMVFVNRAPDNSHYAKTSYQWLVLKCRMLIFAAKEILCSPVLRSESQLYVVASESFISSGKLKELLNRYELKQEGCRSTELTDSILQACLNYSLLARMAPNWNQVGPYLVKGRDFLIDTKSMPALKLDVLVQGDQLFLSIHPLCVRLPHLQLCDLGLSEAIISQFMHQEIKTIPAAAISSEWLHTLPGLRRARILSVSHQIPPTCPFLNYQELRRHWKNMYGYRLPEGNSNTSYYSPAGPYITITFRQGYSKSEMGYTYPALCTRTFNPMILQNVDEASVVKDFASDLTIRLKQLCGVTFQLNLRLSRAITGLIPALDQSTYNSPAQKYPANVSAVALSSLCTGWKPLSEVTPVPVLCSQKQLVSMANSQAVPYQAHIPGKDYYNKPIQNQQCGAHPSSNVEHINISNTPDSKTTVESNKVTYIQKYKTETITLSQSLQPSYALSIPLNKNVNIEHKEEFAILGRSTNIKEEGSVFLTSPQWCKREENVPKMGIDAIDSAAEPMQSATQARATKWAPKLVQFVQAKSHETSEPAKPLYVPVFKKNKTGEHKKSIVNTTMQQADFREKSGVFKSFKSPQAFIPLCNTQSVQLAQSNKPNIVANYSQSTLIKSETFTMTINPATHYSHHSKLVDKAKTKTSLGISGKSKCPQSSNNDTPSKKPRPNKPELSSEEIERLAIAGKLDNVSAPQLVKWLKEHNITCKSRDKKIFLITKVNEYLNLQ